MSRLLSRLVFSSCLLIAIGSVAIAAVSHRTGYTRYARVARTDGTYRDMLIDNAGLAAIRARRPVPAGTTILMETYYRPGELSTIFAERFDGRRWVYGAFSAGQPLPRFRMDGSCSSCHQSARATGTLFTRPMIERFAATGTPQRATCDRSGRSPCPPSTYVTR